MVAVWAVFAFVLFFAEPLFLHRWFHEQASAAPEQRLQVLSQTTQALATRA